MPDPILPPFTLETAGLKVRAAEDKWNTRDPHSVALAYTVDSRWRNRDLFLTGREAIVSFLTQKWEREREYRLIKELWGTLGNRMAVPVAWERVVGVRRGGADAAAGGEHQRHSDPGERPALPLAAGAAAGGASGAHGTRPVIRHFDRIV